MVTGKELLDKAGSIKNTDDSGYFRNKATWDGMLVGGAAGLYYGFAKKKNMLICGAFGAIAGGIIAHFAVPK